jgi:molecular chaperone GrpE
MVDQDMASEEQNGANGQNSPGAENVENTSSQEQADGSNEEVTEEQALRNRVAELEAEVTEQKNEFLRARADLDNTRKRVEKDKQTFVRYGLEGILKDMLPCIDSFEQAVAQGGDEEAVAKFKEGVLLVKKQLVEVLEKHGLKQVESEGAGFDPDLHQAIRKEESDEVKEETVGQVYQQGFMLHDRLLRPAMVSVLMPKD